MNLLSEGIEEMRFEATKKTMEAMAELAADKKAEPKDRIAAAKVVDGMSDSLLKTYVVNQITDGNERVGNKLSKQLDKLIDDKNDGIR